MYIETLTKVKGPANRNRSPSPTPGFCLRAGALDVAWPLWSGPGGLGPESMQTGASRSLLLTRVGMGKLLDRYRISEAETWLRKHYGSPAYQEN